MSRVLVIGGGGYIGSRLCIALNWAGIPFDILDTFYFGKPSTVALAGECFQCKFSQLTESMLHGYSTVILLAGNASVRLADKSVMHTFQQHVADPLALLSTIDAYNIRMGKKISLIYASTGSVYGASTTEARALTEMDYPVNLHKLYDFSKFEFDFYAMQFKNTPVTGLRFGTVSGYSPNFRTDLMINAMLRSCEQHGKVQMVGPTVRRAILGMNDLVQTILTIIQQCPEDSQIYNLASFNTCVADVAQLTANAYTKLTKRPVEVVEVLPHSNGNEKLTNTTYSFWMDSSKIVNRFNLKLTETVESIVSELLHSKGEIMGDRL